MSFSDLRRQIKQFTLSTIAQAKVRDVTSNDVTYPSHRQLADIASLTNNPLQIDKLMRTLWKRLNDDRPQNWRYVLKGLILLEYLLKEGSVKVAERCYENFYLICMLQTYQSAEGSMDHGALIRAKADTVYELLQEPELLAREREKVAERRKREEEMEREKEEEKRQKEEKEREAEKRKEVALRGVLPETPKMAARGLPETAHVFPRDLPECQHSLDSNLQQTTDLPGPRQRPLQSALSKKFSKCVPDHQHSLDSNLQQSAPKCAPDHQHSLDSTLPRITDFSENEQVNSGILPDTNLQQVPGLPDLAQMVSRGMPNTE